MRTRPVRIDQVIPSIVERDAVSHHTLEAQRVLHSMGFVSEIYACSMGPGLAGRVHPLSELPSEQSERQWICYQASIGSPAVEVVLSHPGLKLVDYHNISPSELIERWMPELGEEVRLGRKQLAELAPIAELGFADSEFNRAELEQGGLPATAVAPLMVDTANFYTPADQRVTDRLRAARARGGQDWLFVGQMLPHKAHHDVIKALACARKMFDSQARLHLVGRESCPAYADALRRFVSSLELDGAVEFLGSVSSAGALRLLPGRGRLCLLLGPRRLLRAAAGGDASSASRWSHTVSRPFPRPCSMPGSSFPPSHLPWSPQRCSGADRSRAARCPRCRGPAAGALVHRRECEASLCACHRAGASSRLRIDGDDGRQRRNRRASAAQELGEGQS